MLEAIDLGAIRGDRQLFAGLGFSLQQGELLYVNGPNGSGKTTLLRMLCGLMSPTEGDIRWQSNKIASLGEDYRQLLLYLGHQDALKAELNGVENLCIASTLSGQFVAAADAMQALQRMGLRGFEDLPVKLLSQGQKRRVALTRLLLSKAIVWILDEPFTALDTASIELLRSIFSEHLRNNGIIVMTTHQEVAIDVATVKQLNLGS